MVPADTSNPDVIGWIYKLLWAEPSSEEQTFTCSETFFFLHLSFYMIIDYLASNGVNRKIKLTSLVQLKMCACTQPQNVIILHFGTE